MVNNIKIKYLVEKLTDIGLIKNCLLSLPIYYIQPAIKMNRLIAMN